MSSENEFNEVDNFETNENIEQEDIKSTETTAVVAAKKKRLLCPTLIIATVIFAVTVLFFTGWKCFFDDSIIGTWTATYEITSTDSETDEKTTKVKSYSFTFKDDNVVEYHYGGMTTKGRYFFTTDTDEPQIMVVISNSGSMYINAYFDYSVSGNIFTGRTLSLVDNNGLLFAPEESDNEDSSINNKSKVADGVKYYICDFVESGYTDEIAYYDDYKTDKKLEGSWLYEYDDYKCTYSFYDDGSFEILTSDADIKGAYTVDDGKIKMRYYYISNVSAADEFENELEYSVDEDKVKFINGESSIEFTKTASKYDYKQETE